MCAGARRPAGFAVRGSLGRARCPRAASAGRGHAGPTRPYAAVSVPVRRGTSSHQTARRDRQVLRFTQPERPSDLAALISDARNSAAVSLSSIIRQKAASFRSINCTIAIIIRPRKLYLQLK